MIRKYVKGKVKYHQLSDKRSASTLQSGKMRRRNPLTLYIFPSIFFSLGIIIILSQIAPSIKFALEKNFSEKYAEILSPVPEESSGSHQEDITNKNFEAQYFTDMFANLDRVTSDNIAGTTLPYKHDWTGTFFISIPSVHIYDMPVTANVNSYDEEVYSSILKRSLGHFQGTDLPAPKDHPFDTNSFIYGHSAPSDWALFHKTSFESALNPLFNVNIGDKVIIRIEEEELVYSVVRVKVTKPDDMSSLNGLKGEKLITIMTCAPPGSTTNRLNVVAALD